MKRTGVTTIITALIAAKNCENCKAKETVETLTLKSHAAWKYDK